jgi:hypothetical protein
MRLIVDQIMTAPGPRGTALFAGQTFALATAASSQLVEHRIAEDIETVRLEMRMLHGIGSYKKVSNASQLALPLFKSIIEPLSEAISAS